MKDIKYMQKKILEINMGNDYSKISEQPYLQNIINAMCEYKILPQDCRMEYDSVCNNCQLRNSLRVSHPSGDSKASVDKNICDLGYWEDEF